MGSEYCLVGSNPTLSVFQAPEVKALFLFVARGVAQSGRALRSGRRGPRFKSGRPDWSYPFWSAGRMVMHSPRKRAPERAWGFESLALRFS